MSLRKTSLFAVLISALSLLGCTQPVPVEEGEDEIEKAANALDLVYDTSIDQIAHMSCSMGLDKPSVKFDRSTYFTYRVGAYRDAGMMLKDEFFTAMKKKKVEKQIEILSSSERNVNTIAQVALRGRVNYQKIFTSDGESTLNYDYANLLGPLGEPEMSQTLITLPANERVKYLRNGKVGGYRIEGSLYFSKDQGMVESTREFLTNRVSSSLPPDLQEGGLLALTYSLDGSNPNTAFMARSPGDVEGSKTNTARSVYGVGYRLSFRQPTASPLASDFPESVLAGVSEIDLKTSKDRASSWLCPRELQFRIIRAEDTASSAARCRKKADPVILDMSKPEHFYLKIARNSLKTEDWYIDMGETTPGAPLDPCIIPKKPSLTAGSCYGAVTNVKYFLGDMGCKTSAGAACLAYSSICYRN